uniref:(northern house mosquito) hypothetical protein n=1 Tax=Culex pipiens TaxID=7175 RepID=A0A8D8B3G2_CULPI
MNPHLESKSIMCPKSFCSFVLPFLFWKWNPLTAVCINLPFYQYSWIFAAINMMVNLVRSDCYHFKISSHSCPSTPDGSRPSTRTFCSGTWRLLLRKTTSSCSRSTWAASTCPFAFPGTFFTWRGCCTRCRV